MSSILSGASWFRRDDNAVPAEYLLQPVSSIIPDFLSQDRATKEAAVKKWWETFDVLQHVLVEGAKRVLDEQSLRKYLVSGRIFMALDR